MIKTSVQTEKKMQYLEIGTSRFEPYLNSNPNFALSSVTLSKFLNFPDPQFPNG